MFIYDCIERGIQIAYPFWSIHDSVNGQRLVAIHHIVYNRAPKLSKNYLLFFIFVDPFLKIACCFLFLLIFSTNSTNQQIQQKQIQQINKSLFLLKINKFNKSTFVDQQNQQKFQQKLEFVEKFKFFKIFGENGEMFF